MQIPKVPVGKFTQELLASARPEKVLEDLARNDTVQTIRHATNPDIISWIGMALKSDPKGMIP